MDCWNLIYLLFEEKFWVAVTAIASCVAALATLLAATAAQNSSKLAAQSSEDSKKILELNFTQLKLNFFEHYLPKFDDLYSRIKHYAGRNEKENYNPLVDDLILLISRFYFLKGLDLITDDNFLIHFENKIGSIDTKFQDIFLGRLKNLNHIVGEEFTGYFTKILNKENPHA